MTKELDLKRLLESIIKSIHDMDGELYVECIEEAVRDQGFEYKDGHIEEIKGNDEGIFPNCIIDSDLKWFVCINSINDYKKGGVYQLDTRNVLCTPKYFRPATDEEIPHEPKFKVGDVVTNGLVTGRIIEYNGVAFAIKAQDPNLYFASNEDMEKYHLCTIQDTDEHSLVEPLFKVGDTVSRKSSGHVTKVKDIDYTAQRYIFENGDDCFFVNQDNWEIMESEEIPPTDVSDPIIIKVGQTKVPTETYIADENGVTRLESEESEQYFKVGDRVRRKGTNVKGDVITNIYESGGITMYEFENSDDAPQSFDWELVESEELHNKPESNELTEFERYLWNIGNLGEPDEQSLSELKMDAKGLLSIARKQFIEEACNWLCDNQYPTFGETIKEFRNALEKGEEV